MNYSNEQIEAMFKKVDKNGDGFVSSDELTELLKSLSITHNPDQVKKFFTAADTNKDNKISLDEFTHYIHFKTSDLKEIDALLELTASSISALKKLDKVAFLNLNEEHESEIKIHEGNIKTDENLPTRIKFLVSTGQENKNQELHNLLNGKLEKGHFLALKFHVEDKAKVLEKFPKIWKDAKAFLLEAGPESKEFLDKTEVDLLDGGDGIILAFKAKPECFIAHYINLVERSSSKIKGINASAGLTIGTDLDLAHSKNITFEQALQSNIYFDVFSKTVNLANIINVPNIQKSFAEMNLDRDYPAAAFFLSLISITSTKVDVELDKNLKQKLVHESGLKQLNDKALVKNLEFAKKIWAENPTKDLLESMEFLKEAINLLHDAKIESLSLFAQCEGFMFGVNIKGSFHEIIGELYPLK